MLLSPRPQPCRLTPRLLASALTLLCLAAPDAPAQAASGWLFHAAVVGTSTATASNSAGAWVPPVGPPTIPADASNGLTFTAYSSPSIAVGCGPGQSASCAASVALTVKITATWQGPGPAPPSVEVIETGQATARGTASTYGSSTLAANDGLESVSGTSSVVAQTPSSVPPAHLSVQSGSSWSVTRAFSASAKETLSVPASAPAQASYSCSCQVSLDSYTIAVHAQPYGWYDAGYDADLTGGKDNSGGPKIDTPTGTLTFRYKWHSTDGNLASLGNKKLHIYEWVDYSGNPGSFLVDNGIAVYRPPSPPIGLDLSHDSPQTFEIGTPEISAVDATAGATYDVHSAWPTKTPYSKLAVVAPQQYEFNDDATGEVSIVLFDCGTISEGVSVNPNIFYIRKDNFYVAKPL